MKQVLFGGYGDPPPTSDTEYNSIAGGDAWLTDIRGRKNCISTDGYLKKLRVELATAPGAGKSLAFTLMVNGAASALTCTISDAATSGTDLVNEIDVAPGDDVCLRCVPSGTPSVSWGANKWSLVFEGDTTKESLILGAVRTSRTETVYIPASHSSSSTSTVDPAIGNLVSTSGKIKNLYVKQNRDAGPVGKAYRYTFMLNEVATTLTVTITSPALTGNDTTHEVTVSANDKICIRIEPINDPTDATYAAIGMMLLADTDGESLVPGSSTGGLPTADDRFNQLWVGLLSQGWTATESQREQLAQECTLKNLYVKTTAAPGDGKSWVFTLRQNGADTTLTCTISGANTTCNDTVHEVSISDGDEVDLECSPANTPVSFKHAWWGVLEVTAPPPGWTGKVSGVTNPAKVMGVAVANIAKVKGVA